MHIDIESSDKMEAFKQNQSNKEHMNTLTAVSRGSAMYLTL